MGEHQSQARPEVGTMLERAVATTAPAGKRGQALVRVRTWSEGERFVRAVKRLGFFWGAGVLAAIIPPHWPWLSLCVLIGPVAAYLTWNQPGTVQAGELPCPNCGHAVALEEQPEHWPACARCTECRDVFAIELEGELATRR